MDGKKKSASAPISPDLQAQRAYVDEVEKKGFDFSLVVADAFVRGMRDIGYKSSAWALCELIDNGIQAEAENIHVVFDDEVRPRAIAIIDDGHGMDPGMIRLAAVWGGSHRTHSSTGFGKYGYGLPSAAVSQARRYTVYSVVDDGMWHRVVIDVDEIMSGKLTRGHRIEVPPAQEEAPPDWVVDYLESEFPGEVPAHGTAVLLENLDRVRPKGGPGLQNDLLEHFGVIYRNFLRKVDVVVNGVDTEATDPLFLTPGFRYFDLLGDNERAVPLDPTIIKMTDKKTDEALGVIKVRYSSMPPGFARLPEAKDQPKSRKNNPRLRILEDNNGLVILREGRQIDVVRSSRLHRFSVNNDDRYWGVEIDFPATLDDEFSITTAKQQIRMSDKIWDLLKDRGVFQNISELRRRYDDATADMKARIKEAEKRASEAVMEESRKYEPRRPEADEEKGRREGEEEIKRVARERADLSGVPEDAIERELRAEQEGREYIIETETLPGGPFYRVARRGGPRVLYINTAHRFYSRLYAQAEDPQVRAGLELLLWALGEAELDSVDDERRRFYEHARPEWSRKLNLFLDLLDSADGGTGLVTEPPQHQQGSAEGQGAA